jgi:hypothetical protein
VSSCGNATRATFPLGGPTFTILSQSAVYDAQINGTIVISDVQVFGGYQVYGFIVDSNDQVSINSLFQVSGTIPLPNRPRSRAVLGRDLLVTYEEHVSGTNVIHLVWFDRNYTESIFAFFAFVFVFVFVYLVRFAEVWDRRVKRTNRVHPFIGRILVPSAEHDASRHSTSVQSISDVG